MKTKISLVECRSYESKQVEEAVAHALNLQGGIANFIKPDSKVLVKPNMLMGMGPEFGICTHPEVVRAVIKSLKRIGCTIFVGDGPCPWGASRNNLEVVYEKSGIRKICEEEAVSLVKFDKRRMRAGFPLSTWLDDCDYLVSLPKFKTHGLTLLTGGIKNLFGLIPGTYKVEMHKRYGNSREFSSMLVDIYQEVRPCLTIVDGIVAMEGNGPGTSGKLRIANLVIAGADCVAIDSVLALIMGVKPLDVLTNKEACKRGLGEADIKNIEVLGLSLEEATKKPFQLPATSLASKLPAPVRRALSKMIRLRPEVLHSKCTRCGSCIETCPHELIKKVNGKITIDYSGCISCFCCQECCPSSAIKIKKSLLARIMGL